MGIRNVGRWLADMFRDAPAVPVFPLASLANAPVRYGYHDGEKFPGGFGPTQLLIDDYWTLRARSSQLFELNLYARGLIRRLITNEINTGLHLEATPEEKVLGREEDALADWTELVENRFAIWERRPALCDRSERMTFGQMQAAARAEALIAGDVLVVLTQSPITKLPRVLLVRGDRVRTPMHLMLGDKLPNGNRVVHGVELDKNGKHIGFWIRKDDGEAFGIERSERLDAVDSRGRRVAWLVYGTDKRVDQVRGKPLLSLVLQSLNEIDKYRDSVQRKAVINAMLAMFIKKTQDKPSTKPLTGGARRRGTQSAPDNDGNVREFPIAGLMPGLCIEELQYGEEPVGFPSHGTDEKFGDFETAVLRGIAWANEVPPEILELSFKANYSASQAAINELKMYLNRVRTDWGTAFCQPIYEDWLLAEVLARKIDAPGLLEAWRDPTQYDTHAAWLTADWAGHIKPAVDISKLVKGYSEMVAEGFISRDRATRELTGTKFSKNVQKIARENALLAAANKPLKELEALSKAAPASSDSARPAKRDDNDTEDDEDDDDPVALRARRELFGGFDAEE
jgi:lambda family phage portal protein